MLVSLVLVVAAQRDPYPGPGTDVRGNKRVWQLVSLSALGALACLARGRRSTR